MQIITQLRENKLWIPCNYWISGLIFKDQRLVPETQKQLILTKDRACNPFLQEKSCTRTLTLRSVTLNVLHMDGRLLLHKRVSGDHHKLVTFCKTYCSCWWIKVERMQLNTCLTVPQLYGLVCWASDQPCCIPCSKQFRKQQKKIESAQTRHKHEEQLNAGSWNNHTSLKRKSPVLVTTHKSLSNGAQYVTLTGSKEQERAFVEHWWSVLNLT